MLKLNKKEKNQMKFKFKFLKLKCKFKFNWMLRRNLASKMCVCLFISVTTRDLGPRCR